MIARMRDGVFPFLLTALLALGVRYGLAAPDRPETHAEVRSAFCESYAAWQDHMRTPAMLESSGPRIYDCEPFRRILDLGPAGIPHIVDAMRDESDPLAFHLAAALSRITRDSHIARASLGLSNAEQTATWINWWDAGQKRADEVFAEAYAEGNVVRIAALGWGVMPRIVEKLREGDADLMPAVKQIALVELRVKRIPASAIESPEAWVAWWEANKEDWAIPFPDLKKEAEEKGDARTEAARAAEARQAAIRAEFEAELQAYHDAPPSTHPAWLVSDEAYSHLQKMRWMGPHILPYLVEEARRSRDMSLNLPLGGIARVSFTRAGWPGGEMAGDRRRLELFIQWWDAGQKRADEMFAEAYAEHDVARIGWLGWGVMPRIVEKLREGDGDLMPAVKQIALIELRVKRIPASAIESPEAWVAWWEENKEDWAILFPDLKKASEEKAKAEASSEGKPDDSAKPDEAAKAPEPAPKED